MASQNLALIVLVLNGHAAVMQETRGTWDSGGVFDIWRGSSKDAKDTMNWIAKQEWSDGEVYSMGASADGIDAIEEVIENPSRLHGEWLIWTTGNGHHFIYPGGAYRKDLMLGYFDGLNGPTRGASTKNVLPATQQQEANGPWWYNLTDCGNLSDPSVAPGCRYQNVRWPMIFSAGWWDLFHHTMLDAWNGLRAVGNKTWVDDHVLIVGPLGHNIAGKLNATGLESARLLAAEVDALVVGGELTSEFWRWTKCSDEWAFSNECKCNGRVRFGSGSTWSEAVNVRGSIKCDTNHFADPLPYKAKECQCQEATGKLRQRIGRVNLFIMGAFGESPLSSTGNYWTSLDDFPKATSKSMFLSAGHLLVDNAPDSASSATYTYDPHDPAPMVGGNNLPAIGHIEYAGSADQIVRENRSDVIVFDSAPLTADTAVVGPISATLFVSSSAVDTDFFVTVDDLKPDGSQAMMVRFGLQRMRWREGEYVKSKPLKPEETYQIEVNMGYTGYIFPKGHRVRVSVSSAANPYYVPNSNTGENEMTTKVTPVIAQNTVHFSALQPSRVTLPIVDLKDIPNNPHFTAIGPFMSSASVEQVVV